MRSLFLTLEIIVFVVNQETQVGKDGHASDNIEIVYISNNHDTETDNMNYPDFY